MNKLKMLLGFAFLILALQTNAQDRIYKKNGEIIEARVSGITPDVITFKRFENLEGPEYSIPKSDVLKIKYANGTSDIFEENNDKLGVNDQGKSIGALKYQDKKNAVKDFNIISISPLLISENGYGFGLSYERSLDKRGWISFYCPLELTYTSTQNNNTNSGQGVKNFDNPMFYFMPGIKFYTNLNTSNRIKHSVGVNMILGVGNHDVEQYDYMGNFASANQSRMLVGTILSYGGNIFPTNHFYVGYDGGFGFTYVNNYDGVSHGTSGLLEFSLRVGYRFTKK